MHARQLVEQYVKEETWNYFGRIFLRLCEDRTTPEFRALVMNNMGLARSLAAMMHTPSIPYDDMLSYATEALFRAAERYRPEVGVKFSTWAFGIIRNELVRRRKEQHEYDTTELRTLDAPAGGDDDGATTVLDREASTADVYKEVNDSAKLAALRQAFAKLTDEQRQLIQLVYIDGKTVREVAELTGINRVTVVHRAAKAATELRKALRSQGFDVPKGKLKTTRQ